MVKPKPLRALLLVAVATAACEATMPPGPNVDACVDGRVGAFGCRGVGLVAQVEPGGFGDLHGEVTDIWGWTDPATGTEWALVGHSTGTSFIGLGDPERPVYAGILPLTEGASFSGWRDIKVYRDHAFVVADMAGPHGMQVFDLTALRAASGPPGTFSPAAIYRGIHSAHNLAVNEETGFAYAVGGSGGGETCGGGLHMIDIRDPRNPAFAGCFADERTGWSGTGYTHDATCVVYRGPDSEHRGREVCFGSNESHLSIADVTHKSAPRALAIASYPRVGYAHQAWLDEDHAYLYMNDEMDEFNTLDNTRTLVWDVGDLDDPVLAAEFVHGTGATDHNLYIVGDLMYQSNYAAGFRILNISNRESPVEIAFFETEPDSVAALDGPGTWGSWGNYPFFASGVIPVTSMSSGVLFLKLEGRR